MLPIRGPGPFLSPHKRALVEHETNDRSNSGQRRSDDKHIGFHVCPQVKGIECILLMSEDVVFPCHLFHESATYTLGQPAAPP